MSSYLINMNDGRLVFRNKETDAQVNLKPVPDELVGMIVRGEVEAIDVVNAISAKVKENGDFNLAQYIEDLKKLNVRKSNPQDLPERETLKDRSDETISVAEVQAAKDKVAKTTRKERARKVNAVLESDAASDIPFTTNA